MKHRATSKFWLCYAELPEAVRRLADANFTLLKSDPRHPSLQLKKVGRFWSVRVGSGFRALAIESDEGFIWFWIGTHGEYDRLIA